MSDTSAKIQSLTRDSVEELFQALMEGEHPLPYPSAINCVDHNSEELLEFNVVWRGVEPLGLALALADAFRSDRLSEEIDPLIEITDPSGFASKYLREVIESQRIKARLAHQVKRTNALSREVLNAKNVIRDTNELVGDMYMQHNVMLNAFVHVNQQIINLGGQAFDFSSTHINKH